MSDEQKAQNPLKRYIGKIKNIATQYGEMQKIHMDNLNALNADETPNKYYKGALIWSDAETGINYHVKQMSIMVPRNGMSQENLAKGYSCFITLTLDDAYEVTVLA